MSVEIAEDLKYLRGRILQCWERGNEPAGMEIFEEVITRVSLAEQQVRQLREALVKIRSGVKLMVPEPQQSAFVEICDTALEATAPKEQRRHEAIREE